MSDATHDMAPVNLDQMGKGVEQRCLLAALEAAGYNQSYTAKLLSLTEGRVRTLMRRYHIEPRSHKGRPRHDEGVTLEQAVAKLTGHVPICIDEDARLLEEVHARLVLLQGEGTINLEALITKIGARLEGGNGNGGCAGCDGGCVAG